MRARRQSAWNPPSSAWRSIRRSCCGRAACHLESLTTASSPTLRFEPRFLREDDAAPAPGTLIKHYSPRARLLLFQGGDDAAVYAAMRAQIAGNGRVGLMLGDADAAAFADLDVAIECLGRDAAQNALRLFAAMRALDSAGVDLILARAPDKRGLGLAVWDRLLRAAEGTLIET